MRVFRELAALALLATLGGALGCERKAPGPAECRAFAYQVVGVTEERQLEVPRVRVRVDELTRSCLVTPYDRELLRCVELGAPALVCMRDFTVRAARRDHTEARDPT